MSVVHTMAAHFPTALWLTAFLAIAYRAISNGPTARAVDAALGPLLLLGAVTGIVTYVVGLWVWPWEALVSSPAGRNHLLMGSWTLAYWILVWFSRWHLRTAIWQGPGRWITLGLAGLGVGLLMITGTLGGNLAGNPSAVSKVVGLAGWNVDTTFYVPNWVLILIVLSAIVMVILAFISRARR